MTKQITIVGDGAMGTVCAMLLDACGSKVRIWGAFAEDIERMAQTRENFRMPGYPLADSIELTADDARAFEGVDLILSAAPTQFVRPVWERLAKHVPDRVPIASVAKGIENETLLRPTQIIANVLDDDPDQAARPLAAISGPSIADEMARCLPTTVAVASDDAKLARTIQQLMTCHWFRIYTNDDLLGVELAGATKNVIALAAGILDGLQAGNNAKSALLARGLAEITRLGVAMGATADTFFGIAGVGDLATTCFSPTGRNRSCGEELGRGRKLEDVLAATKSVVEGVPTTMSVVALAEKYRVEMPITEAVYQVLFKGLDPIEGISRLMSRQSKAERIG
jgi:glycerol-3-phosphate dehydrogenase (NAD(P)+)